jgi:F-type H+-transporting ATPase subunit epsilon
MQFDLVSPERRLASLEATSVRIPGMEGDMTVMNGHTPVITTLRPGIVTVEAEGERQEFVVTGGFAEINADGISVLSERAVPQSEMTQAIHDEMVEEAKRRHEEAKANFENEPGPVDDAAKLLSDMVALGDRMDIGRGGGPAPG